MLSHCSLQGKINARQASSHPWCRLLWILLVYHPILLHSRRLDFKVGGGEGGIDPDPCFTSRLELVSKPLETREIGGVISEQAVLQNKADTCWGSLDWDGGVWIRVIIRRLAFQVVVVVKIQMTRCSFLYLMRMKMMKPPRQGNDFSHNIKRPAHHFFFS